MPVTEPPVLIAHRGHAAVCPENTLPALDSAADAGARWVEIDVQLTADGVPVLLHDDDLERTSGHKVSVFSLTAAALAGFCVGEPARFGERFAGLRAPTLSEFDAWLRARPGVQAFVELKTESIQRFGRGAMVDACLEALGPPGERWVPLSYDEGILAVFADRGAERLAWVIREFDQETVARAQALPARWLFRNHERMDPGPLPEGPWSWVPYEVDNPELARDLAARGARWLETMHFGALARALGIGGKSG